MNQDLNCAKPALYHLNYTLPPQLYVNLSFVGLEMDSIEGHRFNTIGHPYPGGDHGVETVIQSISMKITELIASGSISQLSLRHLCQCLKKGRWVGRRPSGKPGSGILGCHTGRRVVNFSFIFAFFEIFPSKPDKPDWQVHCLIFLVLD